MGTAERERHRQQGMDEGQLWGSGAISSVSVLLLGEHSSEARKLPFASHSALSPCVPIFSNKSCVCWCVWGEAGQGNQSNITSPSGVMFQARGRGTIKWTWKILGSHNLLHLSLLSLDDLRWTWQAHLSRSDVMVLSLTSTRGFCYTFRLLHHWTSLKRRRHKHQSKWRSVTRRLLEGPFATRQKKETQRHRGWQG